MSERLGSADNGTILLSAGWRSWQKNPSNRKSRSPRSPQNRRPNNPSTRRRSRIRSRAIRTKIVRSSTRFPRTATRRACDTTVSPLGSPLPLWSCPARCLSNLILLMDGREKTSFRLKGSLHRFEEGMVAKKPRKISAQDRRAIAKIAMRGLKDPASLTIWADQTESPPWRLAQVTYPVPPRRGRQPQAFASTLEPWPVCLPSVVAIQIPANTAINPSHEIERDRLADQLRREQSRGDRVHGHGVGDARRRRALQRHDPQNESERAAGDTEIETGHPLRGAEAGQHRDPAGHEADHDQARPRPRPCRR